MATRQELLIECKHHDWSHMYSDSQAVWHAGADHLNKMVAMHSVLECPHPLDDIRKALYGRILENYIEVNPGEYRDPTWKYKLIASVKRSDLLTQAESDEIMAWFEQ